MDKNVLECRVTSVKVTLQNKRFDVSDKANYLMEAFKGLTTDEVQEVLLEVRNRNIEGEVVS